jgi:hypothetical protein
MGSLFRLQIGYYGWTLVCVCTVVLPPPEAVICEKLCDEEEV